MSPNLSNIPQELSDLIVDEFIGDFEGVKTLSLTHRSFLHRSREILHVQVRIDFGLEPPPLGFYSSPAAARCVRNLLLNELPSPTESGDDPQTDAKRIFAWRLVSRFTQVRHLSLSSLQWFCSPRDRKILSRTFSDVSSMYINLANFHNPLGFQFFLSAFANVNELRLENIRWADPLENGRYAGPYDLDDIPGRKLNSLSFWVLEDIHQAQIIQDMAEQWLARLPQQSVLKLSFSVIWRCMYGATKFLSMLNAAGPFLDHLVMETAEGPAFLEALNDSTALKSCTRLRSIVLQQLCTKSPLPRLPGEYDWVPYMMSQITSSRLQSVELVINPVHNRITDERFLDLDSVDEALSKRHLSELVVTIYATDRSEVDRYSDTVRHAMPRMGKKGTLNITAYY